jgi:NAD(P)-dependent dehydrogenase (short-subunit alcohol dehydrogenase family)
MTTRTALVTGASLGLGRSLAGALAGDGWTVIADARDAEALDDAVREIPGLVAIPGDVRDAAHRASLVEAVGSAGGLDLLVNNASSLGPSPLRPLLGLSVAELAAVLEVNVVAPLGLLQAVAPLFGPGAVVVNVTSDAAVEPYPGWGGYGASKAALDQLSRILGEERPDLRVYAFDPGDMRTRMQQGAFPGEDISDRPLPAEVAVPALLRMLEAGPPSGRYRAADVLSAVTT